MRMRGLAPRSEYRAAPVFAPKRSSGATASSRGSKRAHAAARSAVGMPAGAGNTGGSVRSTSSAAAGASVVAFGGGNQYAASTGKRTGRPVAIKQVHATRDPAWPFQGVYGQRIGPVLSGTATVRHWVQTNGARQSPEVTRLAAAVPGDPTRAVRLHDAGKNARGDVEFVVIGGGGHTWPGGWQYLPASQVGLVSRQVDGNREVLDWVLAHPRTP